MAPSRRSLLARGICVASVLLVAYPSSDPRGTAAFEDARAFVSGPMRLGFHSHRPTARQARGGGDISEERGQGGTTGLMLAAHSGDAAKINQLVEAGAAINAQDDYGWTPLRYAVRQNQAEAAKALLELGADINKASESSRTPLMSAVSNELDDMVKILVNKGADVTLRDEDGLSAWDLSFRGGATRDPAIRELIKLEAVDDQNAAATF
mmetsp:Transcript_52061/g.137541  ORF Transcript_52061/g.137541 Transcript_52061/m.137541 type:complete len:209 (-) Transcript_52061:144-770(-)